MGNPVRSVGRRMTALVLLAASVLLALEALVVWGGVTRLKGEPDVVVVLGAKLWGEQPSPALRNRLDAALDYLRALQAQGIYPPVNVLPSLSRLMKDGIGEGFTRADHAPLSNQLFASYAKVIDARSLASVIGEEELSDTDKKYIEFGRQFENTFVNQGFTENRSIDQSLDLGWKLLSTLPREELDRVDDSMLDQYYQN